VGGSTKKYGGDIEEIRAAVNTLFWPRNGGSKAVIDLGARPSFYVPFPPLSMQIKELQAETTTSAAREIELSTKQQATACGTLPFRFQNVAKA